MGRLPSTSTCVWVEDAKGSHVKATVSTPQVGHRRNTKHLVYQGNKRNKERQKESDLSEAAELGLGRVRGYER
jgi:hypothetical protein